VSKYITNSAAYNKIVSTQQHGRRLQRYCQI